MKIVHFEIDPCIPGININCTMVLISVDVYEELFHQSLHFNSYLHLLHQSFENDSLAGHGG